MGFKLRVLPSAKREAKWLCGTYGGGFSGQFARWCKKIATKMPDSPDSLLLVPLDEVLDDVKSPWAHVWDQLKDRTAVDQVRSFLHFVKNKNPPFELLAAHERFLVMDSFVVNVIAVVNVNRLDEAVEIVKFDWFGD